MSTDEWDGISRDGEEVLWQGKPDAGYFLEASRRKTFFVGALFFAVSVIMGVAGVGQRADEPFFYLFLLSFAGFSLYLMIGQIYGPAYRRRHMFYSLTSQRAVLGIALPGKERDLQFFEVDPDQDYEFRPGHLGSIIFAYEESGVKINNVPQFFAKGFLYVRDAGTAYNQLKRAQRDLRAERAKGEPRDG